MKYKSLLNKNMSIALVLVFGLFGCTEFAKVEPASIADTLPERPSDMSQVTDFSGKVSRVIMSIKKPIAPEFSTKKNLLKRLQQGFNRELGKLPGMVVDRNLSLSINSEIELSEIYGKDSGRQDADFVMLIALDDYVSSQSSQQKEELFSSKKYTACSVQAQYKGWVRVLTLPALEKTSQWEFEADKSDSYDKDNAMQCSSTFSKRLLALQSKMLDNTVCNSKADYLNALAPMGHVLSIKHDEQDVLLETSLGSNVHAKKGDSIYFYHELKYESYAEGVITSISPSSAWVKLESLKQDETIYLYDWVRPHSHELSLVNSMKCLLGGAH